MAKGATARRGAICYVAERIEDKWQKQNHSELAIKAEKLPLAFPEELSSRWRSSKTQSPRSRQRCKVQRRAKTKGKPVSQKDHINIHTKA